MIDKKKVTTGDYVTVTEGFHDYAVAGDIFRIIDTQIPGEETSALGWKLDKKSGVIKNDYAYKLPHEKIVESPRKEVGAILRSGLKKLLANKKAADEAYEVQLDRIKGLEGFEDKADELKYALDRMFSFL